MLVPARPDLDAEIAGADIELARLARCEGQLKLRLGVLLDALFRCRGHEELGFSSFEAYVVERCGRSASWGRMTRDFASRLRKRGLERVRSAVRAGQIGWSMADLLSRRATPENEEELLALARVSTVRAMFVHLNGREPEPERVPNTVPTEHMVSDLDRRMLVSARMLVSNVVGRSVGDEVLVEALLGEGASTLLGQGGALAEPVRVVITIPEGEARTPPLAGVPPILIEVVAEPPLPETFRGLDAEIRERCRELARRNLQIGRLASLLLGSKAWKNLGYGSASTYAKERVGMSLSSLEHKMTLARRVARYPEVERAIDAGSLGYEPALLVCRVLGPRAGPELVAAWIERARRRTVKHLREEVEVVFVNLRLNPEVSRFPPTESEIEAIVEIERRVRAGEIDPFYIFGDMLRPQMSVTVGSGIRMRMSTGLYQFWKQVETLHREVGDANESFIHFLCRNLWHAWLPYVLERARGRWDDIYARDLGRCTSPLCERRDVTPHHLEFVAFGGTHASENVSTICVHCHLEGIHRGRIRADGTATHIRWTFGRVPIIRVHGREKVELAA